jgi:hypothetical protein
MLSWERERLAGWLILCRLKDKVFFDGAADERQMGGIDSEELIARRKLIAAPEL